MRSGKFSCERTLFKKDLARFWPLSTVYTVLWFLLIPLDVFSKADRMAQAYADRNLTGWVGDKALEMMCSTNGVVIAAVCGVLCAMAVWSYLYNTRAANMTHALPVRREGHFAAHFLSGVALFTLPHVIIFLLTAVAGAMVGSTGDLGGIAAAVGILTLLCLFFFCFATLCAFVTGHILALPILYGIANFLVYGVTSLLGTLSTKFIFGLTSGIVESRQTVMWLTPFAQLSQNLGFRYEFERNGVSGVSLSVNAIPTPKNTSEPAAYAITRELEGLNVLLIYAAIGLVLAALALLLYRRRHLETAGDVVAVAWMRPVFQYGVAFCGALAGTYITADILQEGSPALLTILLAVWGIIGYFIARMFLHKTLKVFKSGWKGAAATAAVLLVLCAGLWTDVLGLERRVPDAAQVGEIYISGPQSYPSDSASSPTLIIDDPAQIEQIIHLHQTIVDHRDELKAAQTNWDDVDFDDYTNLRIMYYEHGKEGERSPFLERYYYRLVFNQKNLNDPSSVAYALNEYINSPDVIRAAYGLDEVEPGRMTQVMVNGLYLDSGGMRDVTLYSPLSDYAAMVQENEDEKRFLSDQAIAEAEFAEGPASVAVPAPTQSSDRARYQPATLEELGELWNAVLADFDEGNLGRRWLSYSDEFRENTCVTSIQFFYQVKIEPVGRESFYSENVISINLTSQARHTLEAMEKFGLFEDGAYAADLLNGRNPVYPK